MKLITLNKLNENLRSFFDTIVLPAIKKQRVIVWDKLEGRATLTNGEVQNAGEYRGEVYSYVSGPLTLESKGKTVKVYKADGAEEATGTISIEFEGTDFASLAIWNGNFCYKIKGTY